MSLIPYWIPSEVPDPAAEPWSPVITAPALPNPFRYRLFLDFFERRWAIACPIKIKTATNRQVRIRIEKTDINSANPTFSSFCRIFIFYPDPIFQLVIICSCLILFNSDSSYFLYCVDGLVSEILPKEFIEGNVEGG